MANAEFGSRERHSFSFDESTKQGVLRLYSYSTTGFWGGFQYLNLTIGIPEDIFEIMKGLIYAAHGLRYSIFRKNKEMLEIFANPNYRSDDKFCYFEGRKTCSPINVLGKGETIGQLTLDEAKRLFHICLAVLRRFSNYSETVILFQSGEIDTIEISKIH